MKASTNAPAVSVDLLREAAERGGERSMDRLAQVRALLGDDMATIENALSRVAREGLSPATDSAIHLLEAGGKRVRAMVVLLASSCFGRPSAAAREVAVVAEIVHMATLLHDDVIDDGLERRGRATPRRVWGNAVSVLAGDLLLTHALERTALATPPAVLVDLFATLRRMVDGEVVQLRGRVRLDAREEVYFRIVRDKTSSLFAWACRSAAVVAGASPEAAAALGEFGARVGVAFQLVDDVLDYAGDPRVTGKALLGDLAEGKLTLPLIRALTERPSMAAELDAVRGGDAQAAARMAQEVRDSGACEGVRAAALEETSRALAALDALAPSGARDLLGAIASELVARAA